MSENAEQGFFETAVSEAELMGEDAPAAPEAAPQAGPTVKETAPATETEATPELHRADPIDFTLLDREAEMNQNSSTVEDFTELDESAYTTLLDEDPDEAQRYLFRENKHKKEKEKAAEARSLTNRIINDGMNEISRVLPDIYSNSPTKSAEIAAWAVSHGIDADTLETLTRPDVRITPPGGKPRLLGRGAANLVRLLVNLHAKSTSEPHGKARSTKSVASDSTGKKSTLGPPRGLAAERDFAAMSDAEQEAFLKG